MRSTCFISEGSCSRGIRAVETSKALRNGNKTTTEALCWQCSSDTCCIASRGGSSASQVPPAVAVRASRCHRPQDLDVLAHPSYRTEAEKPSVSFSHPADPSQRLSQCQPSPRAAPCGCPDPFRRWHPHPSLPARLRATLGDAVDPLIKAKPSSRQLSPQICKEGR